MFRIVHTLNPHNSSLRWNKCEVRVCLRSRCCCMERPSCKFHDIPQLTQCVWQCNGETELWDRNTYGWEVKWAPEFIVSNNGGFSFSLNPVYCCLYFMYNFIFLFFFLRCCSAPFVCCVHRIAFLFSAFFYLSLSSSFSVVVVGFFVAFCFVLLQFFVVVVVVVFVLLLSTTSSEYGVRTKYTDWRWVREFATFFPLSLSHSLSLSHVGRIVFSCAVHTRKAKCFPRYIQDKSWYACFSFALPPPPPPPPLLTPCLLIIICFWIIRLANCICSSLIFLVCLSLYPIPSLVSVYVIWVIDASLVVTFTFSTL